MRLVLKVIDTPAIPGGKAIVLCTEDGEMLPMQTGCTVDNGIDGMGSVTARFAIDGEAIRFADGST